MSIFIGGAWVYANGSLHLGHVSSLLPGDILARYYRLKGDSVLYVSGSDCNGTPITVRAREEGVSVKEIADRYHKEFEDCFTRLGFSYDVYTRTDTEFHHKIVQEVFLKLLENKLIYKKEVEQTFCDHCDQFLPDRFVEGDCPKCGAHSRGDQCDNCSTILEPLELTNRKCKICGESPNSRYTEHFYFALSSFQDLLENYTENASKNNIWRENAISLTRRYLTERLQDRAVSRDLEVGVSVPIDGYRDKKIYVWIEAVTGYYSASRLWSEQTQKDDTEFWSNATKSYYVHGKDNIPFHTIIWPGILAGLNDMPLPTHIVSNEYLTLEKRKLSTSKNWAVWLPDILSRYDPDSIRYFLTINAPENRDADFSWKEFIYSHNSELLGAYGNFVNRTLKFIEKSFNSVIPDKEISSSIKSMVDQLYLEVGDLIQNSNFKKAIDKIFEVVRYSNKYFDELQPWKTIKSEIETCEQTLADCAFLTINLSRLLSPFLPFSSKKIEDMIRIHNTGWNTVNDYSNNFLKDVEPLFERIDIQKVEEEKENLILNSND